VPLDDLAGSRIGHETFGEAVFEVLEVALHEELVQERVDGGMAFSAPDVLGDVDLNSACSSGDPSGGIVARLL
jgi:hypothetical protein